MLSKLFGLFKSKPVVKQPETPLVKLGPEKTETVVEYGVNTTPTTQQLEDAFKEEETPKYKKDDGALTEEQTEMVIATIPESVNPVPKKRTPRKTVAKAPAKKVTKNGKSNS
jgi:hypothetical protein